MKKVIAYYFLVSLLIPGCSKDNVVSPPDSLSFSADGQLYLLSGRFNYRLSPISFPNPIPTSNNMPSDPGALLLGNSSLVGFTGYVKTNKLEVITYDAFLNVSINNITYDSSINCTMTITKIENNLMSGYFSGKVYCGAWLNKPPIAITNGKFTDLPVY